MTLSIIASLCLCMAGVAYADDGTIEVPASLYDTDAGLDVPGEYPIRVFEADEGVSITVRKGLGWNIRYLDGQVQNGLTYFRIRHEFVGAMINAGYRALRLSFSDGGEFGKALYNDENYFSAQVPTYADISFYGNGEAKEENIIGSVLQAEHRSSLGLVYYSIDLTNNAFDFVNKDIVCVSTHNTHAATITNNVFIDLLDFWAPSTAGYPGPISIQFKQDTVTTTTPFDLGEVGEGFSLNTDEVSGTYSARLNYDYYNSAIEKFTVQNPYGGTKVGIGFIMIPMSSVTEETQMTYSWLLAHGIVFENVSATISNIETAATDGYVEFSMSVSDFVTRENNKFTAVAYLVCTERIFVDNYIYSSVKNLELRPKEYNIEYVLNGGTNSENNYTVWTVDYAAALSPATKENCDFVGWFTTSDFLEGTEITELSEDIFVDDSLTLYAKFKNKQFTISFNTGTSKTIEPITKEWGEPITAPEAPVREYYTFKEWRLNGEAFVFTTMPAENIELVAYYEENFSVVIDQKVIYKDFEGTDVDGKAHSGKAVIIICTVNAPSPDEKEYGIVFTDANGIKKEYKGLSIGIDGRFAIAIFNVPDGTYSIYGYAKGYLADNTAIVSAVVNFTIPTK